MLAQGYHWRDVSASRATLRETTHTIRPAAGFRRRHDMTYPPGYLGSGDPGTPIGEHFAARKS